MYDTTIAAKLLKQLHRIYLSACFEFNSDGLQRGFTTASPDASHRRAARGVFV